MDMLGSHTQDIPANIPFSDVPTYPHTFFGFARAKKILKIFLKILRGGHILSEYGMYVCGLGCRCRYVGGYVVPMWVCGVVIRDR